MDRYMHAYIIHTYIGKIEINDNRYIHDAYICTYMHTYIDTCMHT